MIEVKPKHAKEMFDNWEIFGDHEEVILGAMEEVAKDVARIYLAQAVANMPCLYDAKAPLLEVQLYPEEMNGNDHITISIAQIVDKQLNDLWGEEVIEGLQRTAVGLRKLADKIDAVLAKDAAGEGE
jgi:hypothetical protein